MKIFGKNILIKRIESEGNSLLSGIDFQDNSFRATGRGEVIEVGEEVNYSNAELLWAVETVLTSLKEIAKNNDSEHYIIPKTNVFYWVSALTRAKKRSIKQGDIIVFREATINGTVPVDQNEIIHIDSVIGVEN